MGKIYKIVFLFTFLSSSMFYLFNDSSVQAEVKSIEAKEVNYLTNVENSMQLFSAGASAEDEAYENIYNALKNIDDTTTFPATKISYKEVGTILNKVLADHPEIFYFKHEGSLFYSDGKIELKYKYPKATVQEMVESLNTKVDAIISQNIQAEYTDFQKVKAIHDYIVLNTAYDYENYKKKTVPESSYTSYGLIIKGVAVCDGYAKAMKLILDKVGVETHYVTGKGNGELHAWNLVKIDNEYYYIDATWDDPVPDKVGYVRYEYFLVPTAYLKKDHSWNSSSFPAANFNRYEYLHDYTEPVIKANAIYNTSNLIQGILNEQAKVTISTSTDGKQWTLLGEVNTITATNEGLYVPTKFKWKLQEKLAIGTKVQIIAKDKFGNTSKKVVLTVKKDTVAPKLMEPAEIVIGNLKATTVTGTLDKPGIVEVLTAKKVSIVTVTTDEEGNFKLTLPKQEAKAKLTFVYKDLNNGKQTKKAITVRNFIPPTVKYVNSVLTTSKGISGTVSNLAYLEAIVDNKVIGKATAKLNKVTGTYDFVIKYKNTLSQNTNVQLLAKVDNKKDAVYSEKDLTVVADSINPELVGNLIITDATTSVQGKINKEAKVQLYKGTEKLGKEVSTDVGGNFKVSIKKQTVGTVLRVEIIDAQSRKTTEEITVTDGTKPVIKKVNPAYNTSNFIQGQVSENATLIFEIFDGQNWIPLNGFESTNQAVTDKDNMFKFRLADKLPGKAKIRITAQDAAGNKSKEKQVIIKEDKVAPKLIGKDKIVISDVNTTTIKRQLTEKGIVDVLINGKSVLENKVETDEEGNFEVTVPKQSAGTKVMFVFTDIKSNISKTTITVKATATP
ncbi:transglutaminase domain-containing protein [Peribacillus asahii]|uniref:transglutaminase domain-containing protein n=1 Tax=Peribacillus asahii TaxID=228899 RepID=UPI003826C268